MGYSQLIFFFEQNRKQKKKRLGIAIIIQNNILKSVCEKEYVLCSNHYIGSERKTKIE